VSLAFDVGFVDVAFVMGLGFPLGLADVAFVLRFAVGFASFTTT